ncbi:hypothetical protein C2W62_02930 [Candidatus Entotheonella serta]|nr:hypothetical protein C2W62_02930 [Candidatus Entotheonella serta]
MALLGTSTLSSDVEALLTQKGEGNPLYLEEITKAVLERDLLQRTENGYVVSRAIDPGDMPETIQDLITARIDRLSSEHKHVLQTASVIGREVPSGLLRQVIEQPLPLEASLSELQRLEFFYAKLLLPEPEYIFKHILTQEAAYTSLLRTRRTALHTAIGLAIQTLYSERLAEHYEALAYHFTQGQCWLEAYRYSRLAGDKAREAYANRDAVDFYTQALFTPRFY